MDLQNFSDRALSAVEAARDYSYDLKSRRLTPAHLAVALVSDDSGVVPKLLERLGADPNRLAQRIHGELSKLAKGHSSGEPDDAMQRVLDKARELSNGRNQNVVRTHHLLMAITEVDHGIAKRTLQTSGVSRTGIDYMLRELTREVREEKVTRSRAGRKKTDSAESSSKSTMPSSHRSLDEFEVLGQFGRDLTELARDNQLDPLIGRGDVLLRIMQILGRRSKNNPILVGEPGVGKSAIVRGFAQRMANGDVPRSLEKCRLVELDIGAMVAGTSLRGQFEKRIKELVREVAETNGEIILYVDEIHNLVTTGGRSGSGGAAELLKPALARGEISVIGTTTPAEFRNHIEADKALQRRFQDIDVEAPSIDESIRILRGIKDKYEIHHGVQIRDDAIGAAVQLSDRYVIDRNLPDKAIDLIDEAASLLRLEFESEPLEIDSLKRKLVHLEVERETLSEQSTKSARDALEKNKREEEEAREELERLEAQLEKEKELYDRITRLKEELDATRKLVEKAQQDNDLGRAAELKYGVIKELEKDLEEAQKEADEQDPSQVLLRDHVTEEDVAAVVADWTGIPVNKMLESERKKLLEIEERLSSRVVGQEPAVEAIAAAVRRSRAGVQQGNRPIGNFFFVGPTGVGKTELAKALAEFLFDSEDSLIRIDMSEYMEQSKVNTLIGAAYGYVDSDKGGVLTEAVRRRPYSVVLFDEAEKAHPDVFNILLQVLDEGRLTDSQGRVIDFTNTIVIMTSNVGAREILDLTGQVPYEELDERVHEILQDNFKPEFLNRLDDTVVFNALDRGALTQILEILLKELRALLAQQGLLIELSESAKEFLIEEGYQPEYGARPLKRAILREIQDPLAEDILEGIFNEGDTIAVDLSEDGEYLVFDHAE
jgi:ATP-dependent Clp protease ATP-binding subunit ClpB